MILLATGMTPERVQVLSQMALIPTWFLAAYLLVIAFAPACLVLWERFGWWSIAGGVVLAGLVDLISIGTGSELAGYPNYLIVWASFHQFGYAWLDGRLATVRRKLLLAGIGAVGLAVLVGLGPYPVSMITAAGDEISNSNPTRVTMAFLGMLQAGLVLLAEAPLTRWLQRPRVWLVTVVLNSRIMTWFLWHLTAMVAVSSLLVALGGFGLGLEPLSAAWWLTRPVWWLVLLAVTYGFVLIFGRFESPRPDPRPSPATWRPICAAALRLRRIGRDGHGGHGRTDRSQPDLAAAPGRGTGRVRRTPATGPKERVSSGVVYGPQLTRCPGRPTAVPSDTSAMAAAAPAFRERVEPYWLIDTSCSHASTSSSVSPGPSEPKTRQTRSGSRTVSNGTDPGRLSTPTIA